MDAPPPRKAPRWPPSLRWAWFVHLCSVLGGAIVLYLVVTMLLDASSRRWMGSLAFVGGISLLQIGLAQFSLFRSRRSLAAKAPGMCPVCEYALGMTRVTAGETPILCPECGYQDTAQGVKAFWTKHLGEPLP